MVGIFSRKITQTHSKTNDQIVKDIEEKVLEELHLAEKAVNEGDKENATLAISKAHEFYWIRGYRNDELERIYNLVFQKYSEKFSCE